MAYKSKWVDRRAEILAIAEKVKADSPASWNEVTVPGQESRRFINMVSLALLASGIPAGVNLKRGGPKQSIDALAFPNETGARDATGTYPGLEIIDIVGNAERPDALLTWGDVTQDTIDAGVPGGWKAGSLVVDPAPQPVPSKPTYPYPDEPTTIKAYQDRVKATYAEAGRLFPDPYDSDAFRWFTRYGRSTHDMPEPEAANKHIAELRAGLGLK